MPVIKSAIKKLRQDKKREKVNDEFRESLKSTLRAARKAKTGKAVAKAMTLLDKASKNNIIHENKASRLKSSLSKIAKPESVKKKTATISKPVAKKAATKKTPIKKKTS